MRDSITYDPNPVWLYKESTTCKENKPTYYIVPQTTNSEDRGWLKLSESAFKFWDNPIDEKWNEVR